MRHIATLFIALLFAVSAAPMSSAQDADWKIAIAHDAPAAEKTAARELQAELDALFGRKLPIVEGDAPSPAVRLGASDDNARHLQIAFTDLKPDEIILKSVGKDLILAGAPPRGTLYAVYEYLERYLGVRFWAPDETYYPPKKSFELPVADYRYAPPIQVREAFYDLIPKTPAFAVKMRNNWHHSRLPREWGGHDEILGWCHTMGRLVSPKKYFGEHPEFFALVNGKRLDHAQLCLTNPDCRKALAAEAMTWLKKKPEATVISISQNDNRLFCTCDNCQDFVSKHGNQTDLLLDAVNDVADAIKVNFPHVRVATLAYQYTRALPKTIRPHDNVIIHLCSIECDFSKPLTEGHNQAFGNEVRAWSRMAKQLFIWNYITNFNAFQYPHPNWASLASDLRFFMDNKAIGVFEQGSAGPGYAGDLTTLRIYLVSKLLWNPKLDQEAIMDEYIRGYYGKCAPFIKDYISLCLKQIEKHPPHPRGLSCFRDDANWLDDDALAQALTIMDNAAKTAKGDPKLELKIKRASSSVKFILLDRSGIFSKLMPGVKPADLLDELVMLFKEAGCYRYREGNGQLENLKDKYKLTYMPPQEGQRPPFIKDSDTWHAISLHDHAAIHQEGNWTFRVNDPAATNGKAVKMPTNHYQWAVQLNTFPNDSEYDVYVTIRCSPTEKRQNVLKIGLYDLKDRNDSALIINASQIQGDSYTYIKYITLKPGATGMFYFAPHILDKGPDIFLDRIIFIKK